MLIAAKLKTVLVISLLATGAALLPVVGRGDTTNISTISISQGNAAIQICGSGCVQVLQQYNIAIVAVNQGGLDYAGSAYLSPGSFDFGPVVHARSRDFTLTNTSANQPLVVPPGSIGLSGANPGDFSQVNNCPIVLPAGHRCTIHVTFAPGSVGAKSAVLAARDSAIDSPQKVDLAGTGVAATMTPAAIDFGAVTVGAHSAAVAATIHNPGGDALTVTSARITGANAADFAAGGCATVAAGASCSVPVTFTPADGGARQGVLTVYVAGLGGPFSSTLSGIGAPLSLSASGLDFGAVLVHTHAAPRELTLTNLGSSPLTLGAMSLSGAGAGDFGPLSGCGPVTLPGGGSCVLHVGFRPSAPGARAAVLVLPYRAGGSDFTAQVSLAGTGIKPDLAAPGSLDFGSVIVGQTASRTLTLSNPGTAATTIAAITLAGHPGDFAVTSTCGVLPVSLSPGATCQVGVAFTPKGTGDRSSTLKIADDADGSPHSVALAGAGVGAGVASSPPGGGGGAAQPGTNAAASSSAGGAVLSAQSPALPNTGAAAPAVGPCLVGFVSPNVGRVELLWLSVLLLIFAVGFGARLRSRRRRPS